MSGKQLRISELGKRAGVSTKTIRFYEAIGVLPLPARGTNGYRTYSADAVDVLHFVKQAQGLGLTLAEIKEIIAIRRGGRPPCQHVYKLLQEKVVALDRKLRDLIALRDRLQESLAAWRRQPAGKAAVCHHIESPARPRQRRAQGA